VFHQFVIDCKNLPNCYCFLLHVVIFCSFPVVDAATAIAPSGWERIKSTANVAVVVGAAAYIAYQLYDVSLLGHYYVF